MALLHRIILATATVVLFLATTGLPVAVSYCCGQLIEQAATEPDDCCMTEMETDDTCEDPVCCQTQVTICKLHTSTVIPHATPNVDPCLPAIAILPVDGAQYARKHLLSSEYQYSDWYAQPPPDQSVLSVFLI